MELLEFRPIREIVTIVRQKQYYCVIRLTKVLISMTQYYCNKSECLRGPFARMNSGPWNWKKNECVGNFRMISSEEIVSFLFYSLHFTLLLFDSKEQRLFSDVKCFPYSYATQKLNKPGITVPCFCYQELS